MEREDFLEGSNWLLRSRCRRLRIGDLMVAVAMIALGLAAISLPELTGRQRVFLGAAALVFVGLQWTQWGLASIPSSRSWPGMTAVLGTLSAALALMMFATLFILGLIFPQGAALLGVLILVQVVYLTTWD